MSQKQSTHSEINLRNLSHVEGDRQKNGQIQMKDKELITEYFQELKQQNESESSKNTSKDICQTVEESVYSGIMMKQIQIKDKPNQIDLNLSESIHVHPNELIEKNIKETKLKESLRVKLILEEKMKYLDQDIHAIQSQITPSSNKNNGKRELSVVEKEEQMKFLKRKMKERKELERKRQMRLIDDEERYKEEQERIRMQKEEEKKLKEIQKKKELEKRLDEIQRSMKEREDRIKNDNEELKKVKAIKPLFVKLQQTDSQIENQTLEVKKKRLAEIRDFHKPINPEELKEHQKKFYENLRALSEKGFSHREKFLYKRPFVSEAYKKIEEERKQYIEILRHPEEEEKKKGPNIIEKIQNYSKTCIKKPKIDPLKQQQREAIIETLQHKPNYKWFAEKRRDKSASLPAVHQSLIRPLESTENGFTETVNKTEISPRKLGNNYLNRLKEQRNNSVMSNNDSTNLNTETQNTASNKQLNKKELSKYSVSQKKADSSQMTFQGSPTNSTILQPMKIDYLKELRIKNRFHKNGSELDRIMKNNNDSSSNLKAEQLLMHAEKLEQKAIRKEKLLRARGNYHNDNESGNDLDSEILDTYINAIKAKFAVLESHS